MLLAVLMEGDVLMLLNLRPGADENASTPVPACIYVYV